MLTWSPNKGSSFFFGGGGGGSMFFWGQGVGVVVCFNVLGLEFEGLRFRV